MAAARPTFRCLEDDLVSGWPSAEYLRLVRVGLDGPPPISELDHPLIRHAVDTFGEVSEDIRRETISGLSDPKFYKLKSGRWRGAIYVDPDGQTWLVAAGLRREGEIRDFYKDFCGRVTASGAEQFLPTDRDRRRLRRERIEDDLLAWETDVHNKVLDALARTPATTTAAFDIPSFDRTQTIAHVTVYHEVLEADDDDPDGCGEVVIEVETIDWGQSDLIAHAEIVAMCAIDPHSCNWTPGHTSNRLYSIVGSAATITSVVATALDDQNNQPNEVILNEHAHYAHKERLTDSYVEGEAVKALCGTTFVPTQLPDGMEPCADCQAIYRTLAAGT